MRIWPFSVGVAKNAPFRFHPGRPTCSTPRATTALMLFLLGFLAPGVQAQSPPPPAEIVRPLPAVIPVYGMDADPGGAVATFQPRGETVTAANAFFQDLGSNGRSCASCHQPQNGWSISAANVRARFTASQGLEPLFRVGDGATCSTADVSTLEARRQAYGLLLTQGLIRIGMPIPAATEFKIAAIVDPYGCTVATGTGLTSPTTGTVSVYRRPLPATNLAFLSTIMWDGREPNLESQATNATLGHAEAAIRPNQRQVDQIVAFETGLFTAQLVDRRAGLLNVGGGNGGPVSLTSQPFFIGINDPTGANPRRTPFDANVFTLFAAWSDADPTRDAAAEQRRSVARGQSLFNTRPIRIVDVAGLNDATRQPVIRGTCSTCHDTPNVGSRSVDTPLNIGVASLAFPALDVAALPAFTLQCTAGPEAGRTVTVTDPGRALVTGKCADIGKFKVPALRGLAARAPFFHNGAAANLGEVVRFYDQRFRMALSPQERADLVAFLRAL